MPCPLPSPQAGTLTCELKNCPYCASALEDADFELSDSESGGSEGNAVYEFTQDVRHGDRRDPMQPAPATDTAGQGSTRQRAQRRAAPGQQGGLGHVWATFSAKLCCIVDSKYFNRGIMVAILTNTLSMGVEYHEQVGVGLVLPWGRGGARDAIGAQTLPSPAGAGSLSGTKWFPCGGSGVPGGHHRPGGSRVKGIRQPAGGCAEDGTPRAQLSRGGGAPLT